jgi:hypothetical protein
MIGSSDSIGIESLALIRVIPVLLDDWRMNLAHSSVASDSLGAIEMREVSSRGSSMTRDPVGSVSRFPFLS